MLRARPLYASNTVGKLLMHTLDMGLSATITTVTANHSGLMTQMTAPGFQNLGPELKLKLHQKLEIYFNGTPPPKNKVKYSPKMCINYY